MPPKCSFKDHMNQANKLNSHTYSITHFRLKVKVIGYNIDTKKASCRKTEGQKLPT